MQKKYQIVVRIEEFLPGDIVFGYQVAKAPRELAELICNGKIKNIPVNE